MPSTELLEAPATVDAPTVDATEAPAAETPPRRAPLAFLSKYRPLVLTERGQQAVRQQGAAPYADSSCRREPDLENKFPSITALVHGEKFAPKLQPGDIVVFITFKHTYDNFPVGHWRLSAVLKVKERFETHEAAAAWYREQGLPLPSNCMVDGNDPLPLEMTSQEYCEDGGKPQPVRSVDEWDEKYRLKAEQCGVFLACEPLYVEVKKPRALTDGDAATVFLKREMNQRNPPLIGRATLDGLLRICGIRIAAEELPAA